MIYEQRLDAVDPLAVAMAAGGYKARRFAAPIPAVATPFLLTGQLKRGLGLGCDCKSGGMAAAMIPPDYGTLRGMGEMDGRYDYEGLGQWDTSGSTDSTFNFDPSTFDMQNLAVPSAGSGAISMLQTIASGAKFIPGIGTIGSMVIQTALQEVKQFEAWFHIGAGRREADIIVPVQNQLMSHLGTITNQILTGGASPSVTDLQNFYRDVWSSAVAFQEFVLMRNFVDRRASGQALNTVMPYIDGTCGYSVPAGQTAAPSQFKCISWGDGTLGGVGQDGMLGAIGRAIINAGGTVPALPDLHQSANSGIRPAQINNPIFGVGGILPPTIAGISTPLLLVAGIAAFFWLRK
jgi:hypothetical protein